MIKLLNHTNKKQKQHQRGTAALLQSSSLFPKYRIQRMWSPKPLVGIISQMCASMCVCACVCVECACVFTVIGRIPLTKITEWLTTT